MTEQAPTYSDEDYDDEPATEASLEKLIELGENLVAAQAEVLDREAALKRAQQTVVDLSERVIPSLMEQLKLTDFTMHDGRKVEVVDKITAGITEANREKAFKWLRDNGHGALIKRSITMKFGRGKDNIATAKYEEWKKDGLEPEQKMEVHTQTLGSFVRQQLEEGKEIPQDLLGVREIKRAEVREVKVKANKAKRS